MNGNGKYAAIMNRLRKFLPEYLREHGINTNKPFKCLNPNHEDKHPSMRLHEGGEFAWCFSCNTSLDIFQAAHWIESKPIIGSEFRTENVCYLANKYSLTIHPDNLTEEDVYKFNCYRAYRAAANYIINFWQSYDIIRDVKIAEELDKRGWHPDLLRKFGVGAIRDFKDFRQSMKSQGFSARFLDDIDLGMKTLSEPNPLFNKADGGLIFTIKNEYAYPIGFITRNLDFTKDKKHGVKYYNTSSKCPIFTKGDLLYNLHYIKNKYDYVYVVEGPADVITMASFGIPNVTAILSTAFRKKHVELIRKYNIRTVCLSLDNDEPGQQSIQRMIDSTLAGCYDVGVKVLIYDEDNTDPDEYLRKHGKDKFDSLIHMDGFKWRLERMGKYNTETPEALDPLIKLVVNEPRWLKRWNMCQTLAEYTGIDPNFIESEVKAFADMEQMRLESRRNEILRFMTDNIHKNPEDAEGIIDKAKDELNSLMEQVKDRDPLEPSVVVDDLYNIKQYNEDKGDELPGLQFGFPTLAEHIGGVRLKETLLVFGGLPNSSKSSVMAYIAYNLVKINPDIYVILHSTDDTTSQFIPRLIALDQKENTRLTISGIDAPLYYYKGNEEKLDSISDGYRNISQYIKDERFLIKDLTARADAATIGYGEFLCKTARERWPGRTIIYILDNFHKCEDYRNKDNERIRFKLMSSMVKKHICQKHEISGICTMEYRKFERQREPCNEDLAESNSMYYDLNLLMHIHNEYYAYKGKTDLVWEDPVETEKVFDNTGGCITIPKRKPIITGICGKTKLGNWSGRLYWKYDPDINYFEEMTLTEVGRCRRTANAWQKGELENAM